MSPLGRGGPLYRHIRRAISQTKAQDVAWEMTDTVLLEELGVDQPAHAAMIVEPHPEAAHDAPLYQVRRIWGISHPGWTSAAVQLEALYVDLEAPGSGEWKKRFVASGRRDLVHEFLHIRGGTSSGHWEWSRVDGADAALAWPEDYSHFIRCIAPACRGTPQMLSSLAKARQHREHDWTPGLK